MVHFGREDGVAPIARRADGPVNQRTVEGSDRERGDVDLKPGSRWASQVCETEVVVVRGVGQSASLECGGQPMVPVGDERSPGLELDPSFAAGSLVGKRFAQPDGVEVLVTKAGDGTLAIDGVALPLKDAKPLPSSD
jgi:hypothetical protein